MRTALLVAAILVWPGTAVAQEQVAVNLRLTIPDFLSVTVERESLVAESESDVTRHVHLRVRANRAWSLVVACEAQAYPAETSQAEGTFGNARDGGVRWRNTGTGTPLEECASSVGRRAAQGVRGDDERIVLEVVAPRSESGALTYALVPR